jgi:hypothetical protein
VAEERLSLTAQGQVRYRLKTPYRDGTTHIVLEPPWTIAMPLDHEAPASLPFECHEGNFGLRNILSAARAANAKHRQTH